MEPIVQENSFGCGVACTAFLLKINYAIAIGLFEQGREKADKKGFMCKDIVKVLNEFGLRYTYKHVGSKIKNKIYASGVIVFIRRSKKYPSGHYLARYENKWMDSWINFPKMDRQAGFRKRLPGQPIYMILPI